jgi:hypothetical protein
MDDGAKVSHGRGFYFHTEGFTHAEVYLLVSMLHYQFNLECTTQKHGSGLIIYIRAKSIKRFYELVSPHFHTSMRYKLL